MPRVADVVQGRCLRVRSRECPSFLSTVRSSAVLSMRRTLARPTSLYGERAGSNYKRKAKVVEHSVRESGLNPH